MFTRRKQMRSKTLQSTSQGSRNPSSLLFDAGTTASSPDPLAASHWAFINRWKVEPQSNDRSPVLGADAINSASPSTRRSTARRKHQAMFKEWSQGRHD